MDSITDYKGAIFDMDGVIVHTERYHYKAWKRLAEELGFYFKEEDNERLKGISRMASLDILLEVGGCQSFNTVEKEAMAEKKNIWYKEYLYEMTPDELVEGVQSFIMNLRDKGIKIALASASKNAPIILDKLAIRDLFDAVIDGNVISKAKPDPEVFIKAAEAIGIPCQDCVVFEDSEAGIEGALRAGMGTVGIGHSGNLAKADRVIDNFSKPISYIFQQCDS